MSHIDRHPILAPPTGKTVPFTFNGKTLEGIEGEAVSSALVANGITVFGHHPKDNAPQGLFCANGQCSRCTVVIDGRAVKSCITPLVEGMMVESLRGRPPAPQAAPRSEAVENIAVRALIVGAGPAGLKAALELGKRGVETLVVDDKDRPGGKLVLQTHNFFGSIDECYAGTRGVDIATRLADELQAFPTVKIWLNSQAVGVFSDGKIGILRDGKQYSLVTCESLLVAAGARERALAFPGCDLPGVYGAGAFQTLVNRDMVPSSRRIFIVGGGNVGLIAAYHAMQAGIEVVGVCEALPSVTGYKVHADKIRRLGVPVFDGTTIVSANGAERVESVTVARADENLRPVEGNWRTFACDTLLVAVGLEPVNEFARQAEEFGFNVHKAGDADRIAEASAAMFGGKIAGLNMLRELGFDMEIPEDLARTAEILRSKPGKTTSRPEPPLDKTVFPVLHCSQPIPCNPCTSVCDRQGLKLETEYGNILDLPVFDSDVDCTACGKCSAVCPGLAITLVDRRKSREGYAKVVVPYEMNLDVEPADELVATDVNGDPLGRFPLLKIRRAKFQDRRSLLVLEVPVDLAHKVAGVRYQDPEMVLHEIKPPILPETTPDDVIVCQCERVTAGEIRRKIREGVRDINALKSIRVGMGSCGGKTCGSLVMRLFREEGVAPDDVKPGTLRPLAFEVPLEAFAGNDKKNEVKS